MVERLRKSIQLKNNKKGTLNPQVLKHSFSGKDAVTMLEKEFGTGDRQEAVEMMQIFMEKNYIMDAAVPYNFIFKDSKKEFYTFNNTRINTKKISFSRKQRHAPVKLLAGEEGSSEQYKDFN